MPTSVPVPAAGLTYVIKTPSGRRLANVHEVRDGTVYWGDYYELFPNYGANLWRAPLDRFQAAARRAVERGARPYWRERDGSLTPIADA